MRIRGWFTSNISRDARLCGMIDSCADDHCRQMRLLQHSLSGWDHVSYACIQSSVRYIMPYSDRYVKKISVLPAFEHVQRSSALAILPPSARDPLALIGALTLDQSFGLNDVLAINSRATA